MGKTMKVLGIDPGGSIDDMVVLSVTITNDPKWANYRIEKHKERPLGPPKPDDVLMSNFDLKFDEIFNS